MKNPADGSWYGFMPRTLLFGSTAAVLHYNCLSRVIAPLACRAHKIPRKGYYGDFGMVVPESFVGLALHTFTGFNEALLTILKERNRNLGLFRIF